MAEWPLASPSYIRLDLFPAKVTRPGESQPFTERGRVIITNEHVYVFEDAAGGPKCVLSGVLFDAQGTNRKGYTAVLDDEDTGEYKISRSTNCGCGSLLRGFQPFPGVPYARFGRA